MTWDIQKMKIIKRKRMGHEEGKDYTKNQDCVAKRKQETKDMSWRNSPGSQTNLFNFHIVKTH